MYDTNVPENLFCSNNFATSVKEQKGPDCHIQDIQSCSRKLVRGEDACGWKYDTETRNNGEGGLNKRLSEKDM